MTYGQCQTYGKQTTYNRIRNKIIPLLKTRKGWLPVGYSNGMIIEFRKAGMLS